MTTTNTPTHIPWALVTGASGGIGQAYAQALAEQHHSLILVARNLQKLEQVASELRSRYDIATKIIVADLSSRVGIEQVIRETEALQVDILINNAGREESGQFLQLSTGQVLGSIALNC